MMTPTKSEQMASPGASNKANLLKQARQLHLYLGVFFAPAILFFSLTGALQLFGLHQGHPGEAYQPPKWIAALASIHKDQVLSRQRGPQGFGGPPGAPPQGAEPQRRGQERDREEQHDSHATILLKWFFLAMSVGLVVTTLLGIYMAFKYNRSRALIWGLLISGAAIPSALIALLA